jgi:prepilin-type N-terminal cleavage/methylation domain-containing protein
MWQSPALSAGQDRGFSLIEVMVAIAILVIGMMASALLMARMYQQTSRSRYMGLAASFASEKLEDLLHYPSTDVHLAMNCTDTSEGSLTADVSTAFSCGGSGTVDYYDYISDTVTNGQFSETVGSGATYTTTTFTLNGSLPTVTTGTTPPTSQTFERRWKIEYNTPVTGVRTVTVLVTLLDNTVQPPVTFQMSGVHL